MDPQADRDRLLLAAGDHGTIAAVLGVGYVSHHSLAALLDVASVLEVVGPFLLGNLVVAALLDAYAPERTDSLASSARTVAATWCGAVGLGLIARTAPTLEGAATWPFGLVVLGFGLLGLLAWRIVAAFLDVRVASPAPVEDVGGR